MKSISIALMLVAFIPESGRGQSVAQTLTSLSAKVTALERQGGGVPAASSFVEYPSNAEGGRLDLKGVNKNTTIRLNSDKKGGNLYLFSSSGKRSFNLETYETGQAGVGFINPATTTNTLELGAAADGRGYLSMYNKAGTTNMIQLAPSSANADSGGLYVNHSTTGKLVVFAGTSTNRVSGLFFIGNSAGDKRLIELYDDGNNAGKVVVNGTAVHDYAEVFDIASCEGIVPGAVVAASLDGRGIRVSAGAYDTAVVGVIAGAGEYQPGMKIGSRIDGSSDLPVAVSGQVYVKVNLEGGAIRVGDLLVSSNVPGIAMRGTDRNQLVGTVVGKALEPFTGQREAVIRMLVLNR